MTLKQKNKKELDEKEDLISQLDKECYLHKTFVKDAVKDETDILLKMTEEGRLKYRQLAADRSEQNKKVSNVKEKLTTLVQAKREVVSKMDEIDENEEVLIENKLVGFDKKTFKELKKKQKDNKPLPRRRKKKSCN